ncbi:MAG TPA: ABC transporter permease [Candidatus Sulfotelmatobacter sp.]|nr:ABC transporter permease [Candidatus Sulfotelmatobacter sp.]
MTRWIESLGQDIRYATRGLRKSPGFTLVVVLTLAIGIGATTAVFSVINGILLRPLPYPDQDRLVSVSNINLKEPKWSWPVSSTDVAHWRADNQVFENLEFVSHADMVAMSSAGSGERVGVQHLSARLLPLLGVQTFMGTIPTDDLSEEKGSQGVLISYEFWKRHFNGDPNVVGKKMFVDTWSATILGVLETGFDLLGTGTPEVYEIGGMGDPTRSGVDDVRWFMAIGKLRRGVSIQQAQAAMEVTTRRLAHTFPEAYKDMGIRVEPLQKRLFGEWGQIYYTLFGIVVLVLLIACANVANLSLVRGDGRRKEIGVRVALGANRGRIVRQVLSESVLLSMIGGVAGLVVAVLGVKVFSVWAPEWLPRELGVLLDARVLLFTFGTCVLTGLAFGLVPAYRAVKSDPNHFLRESGRMTATSSRHRTRNSLVVAEIALSLVLLICAGLMINTVIRIMRTTPGFNPAHLVTAEVRLTGLKYMDSSTEDATGFSSILPPVDDFCRQVLERTRNLPGVEDAALADWLPLLETPQYAAPEFKIGGQGESANVLRQGVSSNYFRIMGIPVLRGRSLVEQDTRSNAWVIVINEAMARKLWKNEDPIGRTITFSDSPEEKPRQIVGIVGNVHQFGLTVDPQPEAYIAYQQQPVRIHSGWTETRIHKSLIVRTRSVSKALMQGVRRTITELAPESAIFGITTVQQTVSDSAGPWRFFSQTLQLFAAVALILAVIGIYGVISYSVGERTHELGLRMALGAQRSQVLGLVLRQAMVLALLGIGIGVAGSFAATPLLAEFLYGVKAHDPLTMFLVALLLGAVTFLASYVPAHYATKIDPMQTLRHE